MCIKQSMLNFSFLRKPSVPMNLALSNLTKSPQKQPHLLAMKQHRPSQSSASCPSFHPTLPREECRKLCTQSAVPASISRSPE